MKNTERKEKGLVYCYDDNELLGEQHAYQDLLYEYNRTKPTDRAWLYELSKQMFAEVGEGCFISPPIHSAWGCKNTHVGSGVILNFNTTLVDDGEIFIGDDTLIAPGCVIATAGHPINPRLRRAHMLYTAPVYIGKNVWIGANCSIMPGVTIGDNTVIGAGSVVTNDIPAGVIAVGVPCRVLREIGKHDDIYYYKDKKYDEHIWGDCFGNDDDAKNLGGEGGA